VFGDSPTRRVSLGADGWLFLTDAVRADCVTPEHAEEIAIELDLMARIGDGAGVEVILLVAPDKSAVYPEHLGDLASEAACSRTSRGLLRSELSGSAAFVDTWAALEAAHGTAGSLLYHRTDTHWTRLGASTAAAIVIERLAPGLWEPDAVVAGGTQRRHGDLVALMGLSFREDAVIHRIWRGVAPEVTREPTRGGPEAVLSEMSGVPVVPGRTVLIHDSMGEVIVPLLRPYFEQLTSVRTRAGSSFGMAAWFTELIGDADVLLLQTVERELVARFDAHPSRDVIAALADRLPSTEVPVGGSRSQAVDLPAVAGRRFLVVDGGGRVYLQVGGVEVAADPSGVGPAVVDVSGLAGTALITTETPPSRLLLVTLP
jgi:hypothetical protein